MMKKSSLGRRSSMMSQSRLSMADKNSSRFLDSKKSQIPRLSFAPKIGRSSSVDRDLNVSSVKKNVGPYTLQRSKSNLNLNLSRTSTPCFTPVQQGRNTGSMYSRLQMSEGGNRTSSMGFKSAKKDSRPVGEKCFQDSAQQKIEEFFRVRAPELLGKGSMKPMSTSMFAEMVNFLVGIHDYTLTVDRKNPAESIMTISKIFNYRGKADKSWPKTVNAPHTWPNVVSFLLWFVELYLVTEKLDMFQAMYPENDPGEMDTDDPDFKLQLWVPHLLKGFTLYSKNQDDSYEMDIFLNKFKQAMGVDEDRVSCLQDKYNTLQEELNNSVDNEEKKELLELKATFDALQRDIKQQTDFNYETASYISHLDEKCSVIQSNMKDYENRIIEAGEEKNRIKQIVSHQEMSQEQKKEIEAQIASLKREIQLLHEEIAEYKNLMYKQEIELVGTRTGFDRMVQAYNRNILMNLISMPELKNIEIVGSNTLHLDAVERFHQVDSELKAIKSRLRTEIQNAESAVNNAKTDLQKLENEMISKQDELDRKSRVCQKLENEINHIKNVMFNDKEKINKNLNDIEEKINQEKKKLQSQYIEEDKELEHLKEKKEEFEKGFQEYIKKTSMSLENRKQDIINTCIRLQEIKKEELSERERRVAAVLNCKQKECGANNN